jgi:hypothetical protein
MVKLGIKMRIQFPSQEFLFCSGRKRTAYFFHVKESEDHHTFVGISNLFNMFDGLNILIVPLHSTKQLFF